jgi:cell wall integrity and stress response component
MAVTKFGLLALFAVSAIQVSGKSTIQPPARNAILNQATSQGCFSTLSSEASVAQDSTFMSTGQCLSHCEKEKKSVAALHATKCYCSETYPAKASLVEDDQCNFRCPGYPRDACGGLNPDVYSVYNTGIDLDPSYDTDEGKDDELSTTGSGSTTTKDAKTTSVATSVSDTTIDVASETETSEMSTPTLHAEETSKVAPVVNANTAAATPSASASTVPENASPRLSNPIGNIIRMMAYLL